MKLKGLLFCAVLAVFGVSPSFAQPPSFVTDSLDSYIEKSLDGWNVPGMAVVIVKDGQVVVNKGYGVLEAGQPEKVNENTLFMIASNTKAFTGTALAMMEVEGKCSLTDPVKKWLPDFHMSDPWVEEHITLTDVLSHRIGMETFQGDFMYWESDLSTEEVIEKFGQLTPLYDFRTKWGYCNAGFVIAGECLGRISGTDWHRFVGQRLLEPLGMARTTTFTAGLDTMQNISAAHTLVDGKLQVIPRGEIDNIAPAASISSCGTDLSHWMIALLDSGRYENSQVIPWQAIQKTRMPASIIRKARHPFNATHYALYGLGWDLQDYEGREIVSHTGGTDGFVTSVCLLPEENLGIAVLTNTDMNSLYQAVKWEIIDAYLGLPYRDYSRLYRERFDVAYGEQLKLLQARKDSVEENLPPSVKLKKFEGRYRHPVYGYADLRAEENHLVLTLEHHPGLTGTLQHIAGDRFLCTYSSPLWGIEVFPFTVDGGKVESFVLRVSDFLEFTTYTFVKEK